MNKLKQSSIKDILIIFFILTVFIIVGAIFYIEINKLSKINSSKKNFYFVKSILNNEKIKCMDKNNKWITGVNCDKIPKVESLAEYFNQKLNLKNPYDDEGGVQKNPGSVYINIKQNKFIILTIDFDANGGIDIEHKIKLD